MKKNKITVLNGHGSFVDKNTLQIKPGKGKPQKIQADKTIIATGSKPTAIPGIPIDKKRIITSTEALNLSAIPKHLILIGGGMAFTFMKFNNINIGKSLFDSVGFKLIPDILDFANICKTKIFR